jgi:hypothetical protein
VAAPTGLVIVAAWDVTLEYVEDVKDVEVDDVLAFALFPDDWIQDGLNSSANTAPNRTIVVTPATTR